MPRHENIILPYRSKHKDIWLRHKVVDYLTTGRITTLGVQIIREKV